MIESIFDAPHHATETEFLILFRDAFSSRHDYEQHSSHHHDNRLLHLWELYQLRGNTAGMAAQEARLNDPHYLEEIKYRDTFVDIKTLGIDLKTS
ncbi:hypothetical protein [Candidatus Methylomicrobium oryzae]|uniref:hypothetical protein n=1 Tax=Candidatus Methylomicrobium oryzae TaxID=2802053 RepID=UPI001922470C|nr:hypothetical protein [Methylomicrobium sp. RS1]MBL1264308.1 hypothetical protein [Methylomicrobium sp. RS1]